MKNTIAINPALITGARIHGPSAATGMIHEVHVSMVGGNDRIFYRRGEKECDELIAQLGLVQISVTPPEKAETTIDTIEVISLWKKGERVRNIQPDIDNGLRDKYRYGDTGTVIQDDDICPYVRWDNGSISPQEARHLQLIQIINP